MKLNYEDLQHCPNMTISKFFIILNTKLCFYVRMKLSRVIKEAEYIKVPLGTK